MRLSPQDCMLFYKLHQALMFWANDRLKVIPDPVSSPREFAHLPPELRIKVQDALHAQPDLIDVFVRQNPYDFDPDELKIVASWRRAVPGEFFVFRYLKRYTVFLKSGSPGRAYGVLALHNLFEELVGPYLPVLTKTVLLPFRDKIVYDGLLTSYRVTFGGGIKRRLNEEYREAKAMFGIVTTLDPERQG
jgi:hypothetical protein